MKRLSLLKLFGTLIFLSYVFYVIDFSKIFEIFKEINFSIYALVFIIFLFGIFISTIRWKILLETQEIKIKTFNLFKYYLSGTAFNIIFPSSIGGDILKIAQASKDYKKEKSKIIIATFMDRFLGLSALLFILSALLFFNPFLHFQARIIIIGICVFIFSLILFFYFKKTGKYEDKIAILLDKVKLGKYFRKSIKVLNIYKKNRQKIFISFVLSLLFHTIGIFNQFLIFYSIGVKIPIIYLFFVIPLNRIITAIPISLGGIGLSEFFLINLLDKIGISANQVISYCLVGYSIHVLLILFIIIYYCLKKIIFQINSKENKLFFM